MVDDARWPGLDYIYNNFHIRKMRIKNAEQTVADWNWFIPCNGWQLHLMVMICRRAKKCLALATTNDCLVTIDFVMLNSVEYYLPNSIFAFRIILNLHSLIHLHIHTYNTHTTLSYIQRQLKAFQRPSCKDGNVRYDDDDDDVIPLSQPVAIHNFTIRHSIFRLLHHWMCVHAMPTRVPCLRTARKYNIFAARARKKHACKHIGHTKRHWWRAPRKRESLAKANKRNAGSLRWVKHKKNERTSYVCKVK